MNTLSYKGFYGTVNFSEKDECFYGKIEGIDGLVNFEGESVKELTEAFHEAVDDYVAYCTAEGITPHKSYSGQLNIRIKPETHSRIATLAKQAGESINAFISQTLDRRVAAMLMMAGMIVCAAGVQAQEYGFEYKDFPYKRTLCELPTYTAGTQITLGAPDITQDGKKLTGWRFEGQMYPLGGAFTMPEKDVVIESIWDNATGITNIQGDKTPCTKVIENGQLYLIYQGTKYNVQGTEVE